MRFELALDNAGAWMRVSEICRLWNSMVESQSAPQTSSGHKEKLNFVTLSVIMYIILSNEENNKKRCNLQ